MISRREKNRVTIESGAMSKTAKDKNTEVAGTQKKTVAALRIFPQPVMDALAEDYHLLAPQDGRIMSREEILDSLGRADALLPSSADWINAEMLAMEGRRVQMIANFGVGYDNIDLAGARAQGIPVTNTPGVVTDCTADLAIMLMLMAARHATSFERMLRNGDWHGFDPSYNLGTRFSGKTLGIIGMGRIGKAVAKRCHFGFDMPVVFFNRSPLDEAEAKALGARQLGSIEEVLTEADIVSLHCPGGAQSRHLINEARLKLMKPTALLINTARGEVVDEAALIRVLDAGAIAGAGLDVFEREPAIPDALLKMPNVTLLPHIGTSTVETRVRMGLMAKANIDAYFAGEPLPNQIV